MINKHKEIQFKQSALHIKTQEYTYNMKWVLNVIATTDKVCKWIIVTNVKYF